MDRRRFTVHSINIQKHWVNFMKEKLNFIEFLFNDLLKNAKIHIKNKEDYEKLPQKHYWENGNYGNKNYGKVALKRKIIYLRQELLNLERMLDE